MNKVQMQVPTTIFVSGANNVADKYGLQNSILINLNQ